MLDLSLNASSAKASDVAPVAVALVMHASMTLLLALLASLPQYDQ